MLTNKHTCSRTIGNKVYIWEVSKLWKLAKNLVVVEVPIDTFNLNIDPWFQNHTVPNIQNIMEHFKKVAKADLDFPIILDPEGEILDGMHRLVKAQLLEHHTIKAVQLSVLPVADAVVDGVDISSWRVNKR